MEPSDYCHISLSDKSICVFPAVTRQSVSRAAIPLPLSAISMLQSASDLLEKPTRYTSVSLCS